MVCPTNIQGMTAGANKAERPSAVGSEPVPVTTPRPTTGRTLPMLWTILIILAIVALVLFILGRVRGGRGV